MLQLENRLTAPVPKLDGRASLLAVQEGVAFKNARGLAGMGALAAGVAGTVLWLAFLAWCLVRFARVLLG